MKIYGLLGKNISYSLSPDMHNAAFGALGLDGKYEIFDKKENQLDDFFDDLKKGKISGCNVTIPYKEKVLKYMDKTDNMVDTIGALNTVVNKNGVLEGHNTDEEGFMNALTGTDEGDLGFNPADKSVFVFGAGGAAKAVVFGLLNWQPKPVKKIIITDVDIEKAEKLASTLVEKQEGGTVIAVAKEYKQYEEFISKSDLLVNATPCGGKESDPSLFDYKYLHDKLYVFDLVYVKDTPLVKKACSLGAKAINGLNMLLDQAVAAFEYWVEGKDHSIIKKEMRKALLGKVKK